MRRGVVEGVGWSGGSGVVRIRNIVVEFIVGSQVFNFSSNKLSFHECKHIIHVFQGKPF